MELAGRRFAGHSIRMVFGPLDMEAAVSFGQEDDARGSVRQ